MMRHLHANGGASGAGDIRPGGLRQTWNSNAVSMSAAPVSKHNSFLLLRARLRHRGAKKFTVYRSTVTRAWLPYAMPCKLSRLLDY